MGLACARRRAGVLIYLTVKARKEQEQSLFSLGANKERVLIFVSLACFLVAPALDDWGEVSNRGAPTATAEGKASGENPSGSEAPAAESSKEDAEKAAYIRDNLKVYDLGARYYDSVLDGRIRE